MTTLKARVNGQWVSIGGGSGTEEVWIGPDDPIAAKPTTELWVDTDEPSFMTDEMRWNTAWGMLGRAGNLNGSTTGIGTSYVDITPPLVATILAGRRYRFGLQSRAAQLSGATAFCFTINNATLGNFTEVWTSYSAMYSGGSAQWIVESANVGTFTFTGRAKLNSGSGSIFTDEATTCCIWIEDLGPSAGAIAVPNPTPPWLPMPLNTGWSNMSSWQPAQYRKVGDVVQLRGLITCASSNMTFWTPIPGGYGPPVQCILSAPYATPSGPHAAGRVDVYPTFVNGQAPVNYLSLNGLWWSTT